MGDRPDGPIRRWLAHRLGWPPESILGTADVAHKLGVTRQRVSQLRHLDPTFPRSGTGYGRVLFWHTAGIECWAAAHRPQRPEAAGRFAGEAGALLVAAEQAAQRLGLHWIDTGLFWLAVAEGHAGEALQAALDSMGMTPSEIQIQVSRWRYPESTPRRSRRMTPLLQQFLASADRHAADAGETRVRSIDILLAFIDAKRVPDRRYVRRPPDRMLDAFERRGLHIPELRRRLVSADADPGALVGMEPRRLRARRRRTSARPSWLDLAPNPLGHDPWLRRPWGTGFARTADERHLKVDGEVWFFTIDGDGFYVRAADGRPVGYRYRVEPKPRLRPVNGFMEILPMPPVDMADWPDRRYDPND